MKNNIILGVLLSIGLIAIIPTTGSITLPIYLNGIGHPHNQDLNISSDVVFNKLTSTLWGDGGNITNITGASIPSYLTSKGHPHNQDLNTTSNVNFNSVTANSYIGLPYTNPFNQVLNTTSNVNFNSVTANTYNNLPYINPFNQILNTSSNVFFNNLNAVALFGDGGNITNITGASIPSYLTSKGHPHNQDLNTTNDVIFDDINSTRNIKISGFQSHYVNVLELGNNGEGKIYENNPLASTYNLLIDNLNNGYIGLATTSTGTPDFKVDVNGITSTPNQASARVRLTNNQNVPATTWTKLSLATEDYDLNSDFASNKFTVPVAGLYQISYSVYVSALRTDDYLQTGIYKNGALSGGYTMTYCSIAGSLGVSGADILQLAVNDYIELYAYHSYTLGTRVFNAYTYSNYIAICKIA